MRRIRSFIIGGIACGASIALHVTLLMPGFVSMLLSSGPPLRQAVPHMPDDARLTPVADQNTLKLGIEESTATTMTWIGHREYEEHIAELRTFEQAAFTVQPSRPAVMQQMPLAVPAPTPGVTRATLVEALAARPPARQFQLPTFRGATDQAFLISKRDGLDESPTDGAGEAAEASPSDMKQRLAGAPPAPATPMEIEVETPPTEPVTSTPRTGDIAQKESDPTSIVKATDRNWKVGKPLAAYGLELQPRAPEFTVLQRLTTSPGNPLVEFRFNARGVPEEAEIIEHSGDSRVDRTILASLYRWRAKGDKLNELVEGELLPVRIRIVLNPLAPH